MSYTAIVEGDAATPAFLNAIFTEIDPEATALDLLKMASGSVINWVTGDITLTHAAGKLTFGGDGAVEIDFNNHEMTNVDINSGAIDGTVIGGASVAAGSFAAVVGTTGAFSSTLAVTGTSTIAHVDATVSGVVANLDNTAAAALNGMIAAERGGSVAYYIGFDASDNFALLNIAANAANLTVTDAGNVTIRGTTTLTDTLSRSVTNTITAGTTQTQAGATTLTTDINRVTIIGTNGDGVELPTAIAGLEILIINDDSAQTLQVWPNTSDAIDGGSADAVDTSQVSAGASRTYIAVDATNWYNAIDG